MAFSSLFLQAVVCLSYIHTQILQGHDLGSYKWYITEGDEQYNRRWCAASFKTAYWALENNVKMYSSKLVAEKENKKKISKLSSSSMVLTQHWVVSFLCQRNSDDHIPLLSWGRLPSCETGSSTSHSQEGRRIIWICIDHSFPPA